MKTLTYVRRVLGIDTQEDKYSYGRDAEFGLISASRVADTWVKTTCGYCSVGCGMLVGVKDGKAVAARGNPDHPVNAGKLCPKGLSEHHILTAPGRSRTPLLRKNGVLMPVTWDEALDTMIEKIGAVQEKHGSDALGVISTGQLVTEEFYTLGKLVQLGFRTRNYDGNTTLCMASAVSGYKLSFGSDGPPGAYADLEHADVILLIGANIADNHPILCQRLDRNKNCTLIVIDPRVTKTAMMADLHLPITPRSDIALLNGIAHILIREGLTDRNYIAQHTTGYEEFATFVSEYTPDRVAATTGIPEETLIRTALLYGHAKAAFIGWTMGVNHSTQGAVTVATINNLALITGNVGRIGASPFSITGQCNAMGTRESGFASSLPGYRKFERVDDREDLARLWNISAERIPSARGLAYPDIIEAAVAGKVKALWIIATNPAVSFPITPFSNRLCAVSISSSRRMAFIPRQPPNSPTSFFPPPSGEKRKALSPTQNAESARSTVLLHLRVTRAPISISSSISRNVSVCAMNSSRAGRLLKTHSRNGSVSLTDAYAITVSSHGRRLKIAVACSGADRAFIRTESSSIRTARRASIPFPASHSSNSPMTSTR